MAKDVRILPVAVDESDEASLATACLAAQGVAAPPIVIAFSGFEVRVAPGADSAYVAALVVELRARC
ncbi:MAG TPA: hypothetical protein VMI75_26905 [Polyangiaceae bacterium]|nr:hypothetical protein [Polyangiaceae bacterium]